MVDGASVFDYPFVLAKLTTNERDALVSVQPGMEIFNVDTTMAEIFDGYSWSPQLSRFQLPDMPDAIVDETYLGALPGIYRTLLSAIADGGESIYLRDASSDTGTITVAAGDKMQRLWGKDADTTILAQSITCNKDNVTFEQFALSSKILAISATQNTIEELLVSGSGQVTWDGNATYATMRGGLFVSTSAAGFKVGPVNGYLRSSVIGTRFLESQIDLSGTGSTRLVALRFENVNISWTGTGYAVNVSASGVHSLQFDGGSLYTTTKGIYLKGFGQLVTNMRFDLTVAAAVGIELDTDSFATSARIIGNEFYGPGIGFQYIGSGTAGIALVIGNTATAAYTGLPTFKGAQGMQWIANDFPGCTIDWQTKPGQVVIGGDMTGITELNIPADLVMRNVKGQADRGTYTGGTWAAGLLPAADSLYSLGLFGGNRWLAINAVGLLVINSTTYMNQATLGNLVSQISSVAANDDPQENIYQNRVTTTNATQTTLHTIPIVASNTYKIRAEVTARRTGGSAGTADDAAAYEFVGTYKTAAGVVTLIGAVTALYTAESQAGWDATFTISGTNVLVRVTGATNNNIVWHLSKLSVELVGT